MSIGLVLIALLVLGGVLAATAAAPASDRSRRRHETRRSVYVRRNPCTATSHDITQLLVAQGMAAEQARFVTTRAAGLGITPFTMWLWLDQFDAEALGLVVGADLTTAELVSHLCAGTAPDLDELRVFAAANGLEITAPKARRLPSTLGRATLATARPEPVVYAAGTLPDGRRLGDLPRDDVDGLAA